LPLRGSVAFAKDDTGACTSVEAVEEDRMKVDLTPDEVRLLGSEQEFDKRPILCGFPKKHEFGLGDSHALSLEQQVA
jgi:hypothetical protein